MRLPKAVVFDLGKVLLDFDYRMAARAIEPRCRAKVDEIMRHFGAFPVLLRYETGLMTTQEFYEESCRITGYTGTAADFAAAFGDIFTPIVPMIELQTQLRAAGFPTYIFSNTNELAMIHVRKTYPFFGNFNGYILSFEHHGLKPEPEIYGVVERVTGRRGADLLYIDDRPENIATGQARGWQTILQETPEKTIAAVQKLGLFATNPAALR